MTFNKFNNKFHKTIYFLPLLVMVFTSCLSQIPYVSIDNIEVKNKFNIKVALIITNELKNKEYRETIRRKCKHRIRYDKFIEEIRTNEILSYVGKGASKFFEDSLSLLFDQVDIYNTLSNYNLEKYDLILTPNADFLITYVPNDRSSKRSLPSIIDLQYYIMATNVKLSINILNNITHDAIEIKPINITKFHTDTSRFEYCHSNAEFSSYYRF